MLFNLEKVTEICSKRNITPNQLFFMYAIYNNDWKLIYNFLKITRNRIRDGKEIFGFDIETELKPLVELGYLVNWKNDWSHLNSKDYQPIDYFELTDKFKYLLFIDTEEAGEELFREYPKFITINNTKILSTQGGDYKGKYCGKDELIELYCKKINNNYDIHKENMKGIEKAKKNKSFMFPLLRKYILDELWHSINEMDETTVYSDDRLA